jgi:hypothetical protein
MAAFAALPSPRLFELSVMFRAWVALWSMVISPLTLQRLLPEAKVIELIRLPEVLAKSMTELLTELTTIVATDPLVRVMADVRDPLTSVNVPEPSREVPDHLAVVVSLPN